MPAPRIRLAVAAVAAPSADWPLWAGGPTRNTVSPDKGLPFDFRFEVADGETV